MLTLFTTPKPFRGPIDLIQRNALKSWTLLHPDVEIIVVGDDAGASDVCRELGLQHEPRVERRDNGTKSVWSIFGRAQEIARHERMCYCNSDIILTADFPRTVEQVGSWQKEFFLVGRRWDVDVTAPIYFDDPKWEAELVARAHAEGFQRLHYNIDYFVFPRGLYRDAPGLVIGRNWWDQWLVWRAGAAGLPVVDATDAVCAVHQNHDYSYHPLGMAGVWYDETTQENFRQAGGWSHLHTIEDAKWRITAAGIVPNRWAVVAPARRHVRRIYRGAAAFARTRWWHPLLDRTRPFRHVLGLRQSTLGALRPRARSKAKRHWLDL